MEVFTDASAKSTLGWGIFMPSKNWWSYGQWQKDYIEVMQPSIDFLEMYAVLIFLVTQQKQLANHKIHFRLDNMLTIEALSNLSSCSPHLILLIRVIALTCLLNNIRFTISHIKGKFNTEADNLFCLKLDHFLQQVPNVKELQYLNPQGPVWPLSSNMLETYYMQLTEKTAQHV